MLKLTPRPCWVCGRWFEHRSRQVRACENPDCRAAEEKRQKLVKARAVRRCYRREKARKGGKA